MGVLARATSAELTEAWAAWEPKPQVDAIRGPQVGLVMVRGRIGGGGDRFNVGEAAVTRATLRLSGEPLAADQVGSAYVLGTAHAHAWLAATFDGLLADETVRERVLADVVEPLERRQHQRDALRDAEARSTKVDFFTVARENG